MAVQQQKIDDPLVAAGDVDADLADRPSFSRRGDLVDLRQHVGGDPLRNYVGLNFFRASPAALLPWLARPARLAVDVDSTRSVASWAITDTIESICAMIASTAV